MAFFPMFFDLEDQRVLVVGAGPVGSRRIETLLQFGALITVVALKPSEAVRKLAEEGQLQLFISDYNSYCEAEGEKGTSFFMVVAATGVASVDEKIKRDAKAKNAFVNVAGDKEKSDFYFPGIAKEGFITAGIIAEGLDHKLAKQATKQVRAFLHKTYN